MLVVKLNRTLWRRLIKKIYFFFAEKCLQCWSKYGIIKAIQEEVNRRKITMSKRTTTYIRYYFDRGEWRMTKDRCVLRTGRGLDSAIAAEKELRAKGIPMRFLFIEGWKALNGLKNILFFGTLRLKLTKTNKRAKALFITLSWYTI